jgi:hypothetical protein
MSRSAAFSVTCDIDKSTVGVVDTNASDSGENNGWTKPAPTTLPEGWMNLQGELFGSTHDFNGNNIDVCPTCLAQLSGLPEQWQAIIPAIPS